MWWVKQSMNGEWAMAYPVGAEHFSLFRCYQNMDGAWHFSLIFSYVDPEPWFSVRKRKRIVLECCVWLVNILMRVVLTMNRSGSSSSALFMIAFGMGIICGVQFGNEARKSGNCVTPGHVVSVGVPITRKMRNNWSISLSPANRGFLRICGIEFGIKTQTAKYFRLWGIIPFLRKYILNSRCPRRLRTFSYPAGSLVHDTTVWPLHVCMLAWAN